MIINCVTTARYGFELIEPLPNRPMHIDRLIAQINVEVTDNEMVEELDTAATYRTTMQAALNSQKSGGCVAVENV